MKMQMHPTSIISGIHVLNIHTNAHHVQRANEPVNMKIDPTSIISGIHVHNTHTHIMCRGQTSP
jgi:hypothetical protein